MSAEREIINPELPQDVPKKTSGLPPPQIPERYLRPDLLLEQNIKVFLPDLLALFCLAIYGQNFSSLALAKVSKIVLLCYQLSKISKFFSPAA